MAGRMAGRISMGEWLVEWLVELAGANGWNLAAVETCMVCSLSVMELLHHTSCLGGHFMSLDLDHN